MTSSHSTKRTRRTTRVFVRDYCVSLGACARKRRQQRVGKTKNENVRRVTDFGAMPPIDWLSGMPIFEAFITDAAVAKVEDTTQNKRPAATHHGTAVYCIHHRRCDSDHSSTERKNKGRTKTQTEKTQHRPYKQRGNHQLRTHPVTSSETFFLGIATNICIHDARVASRSSSVLWLLPYSLGFHRSLSLLLSSCSLF